MQTNGFFDEIGETIGEAIRVVVEFLTVKDQFPVFRAILQHNIEMINPSSALTAIEQNPDSISLHYNEQSYAADIASLLCQYWLYCVIVIVHHLLQ